MMKFHIKNIIKFMLLGSTFSIIFLIFNISTYFNVDQLCAYHQLTPYIDNLDLHRCIERRGLKSIQLLTNFFNFKDWAYESLGETPFKYCPVERRCYAFRYISEYQKPVESSHGVLVHVPNLVEMPKRSNYNRGPKQLWSFFSMEPSRFTYCNLGKTTITDMDNWFNITQTIKSHHYLGIDFQNLHVTPQYRAAYRRDRYLIEKNPISKILAKKKKSLAVWFVSRCQTPNGRERYVKELANYINVDIYGRCGNREDPCKLAADSKSCMIDIYNSYKFYLAFENSNCDMYISEKFFKFYEENSIFKINIVPIVMGATLEQYKQFAPLQPSFIYAHKDVRRLADYLTYLDKNDTAYLEYFNWKVSLIQNIKNRKTTGTYKRDVYQSPLCDLCALVHNKTFLKQTHKPILISEEYNFLKDCSSNDEFKSNTTFDFDSLKNRCYRNY